MLQILEHQRRLAEGEGGDLPAFRQFLGAFVPAFCRASNNLLDLRVRVCGGWGGWGAREVRGVRSRERQGGMR